MAIPQRVVIVGSGVFGLSTAYHISRDPAFANSKILLVDPWDFEPDSTSVSVQNPGASNADTSRIIRLLYPQGPYAALAREARQSWLSEWGKDGRYVEQRLLFTGEGSSIHSSKKRQETVNYIKDSYVTCCQLTPGGADSLEIWDSLEKIRAKLRTSPGSFENTLNEHRDSEKSLRGFVSDECGWANAGATMEWLRQEVVRAGRVECCVGEVQQLLHSDDGSQVSGVLLRDGREIRADLTIVAAGCHSARIVGVPEMCSVESAIVAYIQLSDSESEELKSRNWPLIINTHRGVFCVGPDHDNRLKMGACSTGSHAEILRSANLDEGPQSKFTAPVPQPRWEDPSDGWGGNVKISPQGDILDSESDSINKTLAVFRTFLLELLGPVALGGIETPEMSDSLLNKIAVRPFARIHKCWYNDTPSYDFIVDFHPSYAKSLFVASGGCDHAFKFLPVLGERVTSLILHHLEESSADKAKSSAIAELGSLWKFPAHLVQ